MNIKQWCCTMWVICLKSVFVLANDWSCGIGVVTKKVSYAMVFMSDSKGVNQCCIEHDQLIDMSVHRQEADRVFCQCLANSGSWYVRNVVKHLYCASVSFYTLVLAGEPRKFYLHELNQTAVEHGHLNQTGDLISVVSSGAFPRTNPNLINRSEPSGKSSFTNHLLGTGHQLSTSPAITKGPNSQQKIFIGSNS
ncbi:hypothetical protein WR25_17896 [Diploscapter pachys]|uniref:Uncharacterized protein n=1 Tax=Diploscapter pachys TaxID=2018661 RepID=A0A2A2KTU9_9BILA|nr:hypothetical protein WR25_17896 [Diploscapter pachys]